MVADLPQPTHLDLITEAAGHYLDRGRQGPVSQSGDLSGVLWRLTLDAGHAVSLTASQIVQSFSIQPYSAAGCPVRKSRQPCEHSNGRPGRQTYVQSPRRAVNGVFEVPRPVLDTRPFAMDLRLVQPMGQWFKADTTQGAWLWGLAVCSRKSV
ncbi:hypothetical protein CSAL01_08660 [Colletotrichum salicis]|uniref:Uncharacterized protein n=1 Tax=Colletotrichum salicis TaxID=1209931 RepID=A0A135UG89_9PEZI|nr:hypothetical protein CSAL01_08660 [Colletotrichum salicis]